MQLYIFITVSIVLLAFLLAVFGWVSALRRKVKEKEATITKEKEESTRRLYEISILKEIGERTGYSLDVEEIMQIITGSLRQFIDYTAVSYAVIYPEKVKLNTHFEQSVDRGFLDELKKRMLASLEALLDKGVDLATLEEVVSGAIFADGLPGGVQSYFNIPLTIGGKLRGLLTVAHTTPGLYKEADMTILYKIVAQASQAVARLQEVVAAEKGKLNAMVESMGDGVVMVDPEYRIIVANPAVRKIINTTKPEISIFDFVDSLGGKFDIHGKLEKALSRGETCLSEKIEIEGLSYEIGVCPVRQYAAKGETTYGAVVVFHDITKDIQLERVKEEFTSMIVHELRSPLDGMKKILELMVSGTIKKASPKFKEYMGMVYASSSTMLELVNDILDYSKLSAGKFEIHKKEADIKEVLKDRVMFYSPLATTKNIDLSEHVDSSAENNMTFDDHALKQVMNNYISNALKFTGENGRIRIVSFVLDPGAGIPKSAALKLEEMPCGLAASDITTPGPALVVAVQDSGVGIKEGQTKELFFTYKQLEQGFYSESKGTGLGLAIAKGIVEAHGGQVGANSIEGRGSCFYFAIPARG
jgi:two-component system, NtrC family, sensor histidine kinase KinB